jgi:DNA repair exonuclease SbcCD ATPase subunit
VGSKYFGGWRAEWAKDEASELEKDLVKFARENIPELQKLIDEIYASIEDRNTRIEKLQAVLIRLDEEPDKDEDYLRWRKGVETLKADAKSLCEERKNAFKAFKKYEIGRVAGVSELERNSHVGKVMERVKEASLRYKKVLLEFESGERIPGCRPKHSG